MTDKLFCKSHFLLFVAQSSIVLIGIQNFIENAACVIPDFAIISLILICAVRIMHNGKQTDSIKNLEPNDQ